jgi:sec-independent protein translocase protein TatB
MFGLSFVEIAIVAVLALLLLGPDQLPSVAKTIGKGLRELRKASDDLKGTFETEMSKLEREVEQAQVDKPAAPAWTPPAAPDPAAGVPAPAAPAWTAGGLTAPIGAVVPLDQLRQMASQDPGAMRALARQNAIPKDPGSARAAAAFAARAQRTAAEAAPPAAAAPSAPPPAPVVAAPEAPAAAEPIAVSPAAGAVERKPEPS